MKIDIRNSSNEEVTEIQFADDQEFSGCKVVYDSGSLKIVDVDNDTADSVEFDDIDNFILALQKAKEMWS